MHPHLINSVAAAETFVLGGNCRFTLVSRRTNDRFTFKVRRDDDRFYVSVLTGSNNETDYQFIGTIFADRQYRHGRNAKIADTAPSVAAFRWVWGNIVRGDLRSDQVEFWHEGRCCRCNRTLTDPVSIERGIGPECAQK